MKILMINNRPPYCGIGEYTFSLFRALKILMGEDAELVSWQSRFIDSIYARVRERYLLQYPEEALRIISQLKFLLEIPRNYSVYHFTNSSLSLAAGRAHPCVITVHDLIPFNSPRDFSDYLIRISMKSLKHAQRIICVSQNTKADLLRYLNIDPTRVKVVYEGVDHNLFKPGDKAECRKMLGLEPDKVLVLNVGSEEPRKNIPTLVNAFHRLHQEVPDAILVRVGEMTMAVQRQINSLGLKENVKYFHDVKDLVHFYNAADMLVFPSLEEGFGFPPLQAMASGCPVITSNTTSIPEVVGDAGVLVDPADSEAIAQWMQKIVFEEDLSSGLIQKGLERSKIFTWEKAAWETLEVYREAIS